MTDYSLSPEIDALYLVGSDGDERRDIVDPAKPYRMAWGDFEDSSLGTQFALAMEKLEGLMYALYGSVPIYDHTVVGDWKPKTWEPWERPDPRLMWGAEQYEEYENYGETAIWQYPLATSALGQIHDGDAPQVPIRSRSGDPQRLFAATDHNQEVFPLGSVIRATEAGTANISFPHDPAGLSSDSRWPTEDDVKIIWDKPSGVNLDPAKDPPKVYVKFSGSGGDSYSSYEMIEDTVVAGRYACVIPAQDHDTWCGWHIKVNILGSANPVYDPQVAGSGQPVYGSPNDDPEHDRTDDQGYTFRWYSHYNPYANGLPEMIDKWRKGTDRYLFDAAEEIQPALINLVRYVLDRIVEDHDLQHNPNHRGGSGSVLQGDLCCVRMPIRFYWSGSNTPDMYIAGGKDADGSPLTNHPQVTEIDGDEDARFSWRGHKRVWHKSFILDEELSTAYACHLANYDHGDDESWLSWGDTILLEEDPDDPTDLVWLREYGDRGLKSGDMIDPIHIVEIIEAVDYLIDEGCWKTQQVEKRKRTVTSHKGLQCGEHYSCDTDYDPECESWIAGGQGWCGHWVSGTWSPYPEPTSWEDCKSNYSGQCNFTYGVTCGASDCGPDNPYIDNPNICDGPDYSYGKWLNCSPSPWTGETSMMSQGYELCDTVDGEVWVIEAADLFSIEGSFYYLCGPDDQDAKHIADANGACDDSMHGNGSSGQRREKTDGTAALWSGYSMGNKFDAMEACKEIDPSHQDPPDFKTVTPVIFDGIAPHWEMPMTACLEIPTSRNVTPREAPGLGKYHWVSTTDEDGNLVYEPDGLLCLITEDDSCDTGGSDGNSIECNVSPWDYPVCQGDEVYVRVGLNVDARGIPQLYDYPSSMRNPPDWRGLCNSHFSYYSCTNPPAIPDPPIPPT